MATFRIHLEDEWVDRRDLADYSGPMFSIYSEEEDKALNHINVLIDTLDIHRIQNENGVNKQSILRKFKLVVIRYGVEGIERGIREGIFPQNLNGKTYNLIIEDLDIPVLRRLLQGKTCSYQIQEGRDLLCSAASSKDPTNCGKVGFRFVAPTSRAICNECSLPHTDYLCSHFLHPQVEWELDNFTNVNKRKVISSICDLGKEEIENPEKCCAGDNQCWERIVERIDAPVPTLASPLTLPEAFDFLDTVWRLAFGKKRGLLRLRSTTDTVSLVLACSTRDEFKSRVSALDDIFKSMEIPDGILEIELDESNKGHTFVRLLACLETRLETIDYQEVEQAVNALRAVNEVRVAFQHSGAASRLPDALRKLGIPYPPSQWGDAWDRIRAKVSEALHIIREKVRRWDTESSDE